MYSVKQTQSEWLHWKEAKPWQQKKLTRSWNKYKKQTKRLTNKIMRREGMSKHYWSGYEYCW